MIKGSEAQKQRQHELLWMLWIEEKSISNVQLLLFCSGKTFDNGKSTISTKGTICGGKAVGISVDVNVFQPHILAANLAHAIGK